MSCPDLDRLAAPHDAEVAAHAAGCAACAVIVELARERDAALACARFEDLLAVRGALPPDDAAALEAHLAGCVACRAIASTMAPVDDVRPMALPTIDTTMYTFGREVARGGMGRVVAAHDLRIGRPVAVKELLGRAPSTAARFEREARITARLQHPGIVPIYEIGAWPDGTPFYAMRMVEGRTLSAALADADNRLALLPAVIAAADAVAFAHAHDVIHRDLKPSNIMVGAFGETVVIDWGLAKELATDDPAPDAGPYREQPESSGLTAVGEVMGTAAYMPPEQAAGDAVDRRADVYALGAILYHLLAGSAPYKGATSLEIVEKVKTETPRPLPADAPRDLASIVAKAMARSPNDRYPSARELAEELERFQTGRVVEAHAYSRGELLRRWLRRHRAAVIGGVAALVALVIAGSIGLAGVLRERDIATAHEAKEHAIATALLEEQGRPELLAGRDTRALAYLDAAMQQGLDTPALRFMLARALPSIENRQRTLSCPGEVRRLATDRLGGWVAALCGDSARVWNPATGAVAFTTTATNTWDISFSPDGHQLLLLGDRARLVDEKGVVRFELGARATVGRFSPNGGQAIVVYRDATVRVWDTVTGAAIRTLGRPSGEPENASAAVSRDGRIVAVGTAAGHVSIYNVETGQAVASFEHGPQIIGADTSDDGGIVMMCGTNGRATIWRADGSRLLVDLYNSALVACALTNDGARALLGTWLEAARIVDTHTGDPIATITAKLVRASFSRDGRFVVGGDGPTTRLMAADTGVRLASFETNSVGSPSLISEDGATVYIASASEVIVAGTASSRHLSFVPPADELMLDASQDGTRIVTQRRDGSLWLWNAETGRRLTHAAIRAAPQMAEDLPGLFLLSGDGHRLAAWNGSDAVLVIDVATGATIGSAPAARQPILQLDDRGGRVLITGDGAPRVWDVDRSLVVARIDRVQAQGLSGDGHSVLIWSAPDAVDVWDIDANRARTRLAVTAEPYWLAYDATGTRVLLREQAGDFGAAVYGLYDVTTGHRLHAASGFSAIFDPSGNRVAMNDGVRLQIWSALDGHVLHDFVAPDASISAPDVTGAFAVEVQPNSLAITSTVDGRTLAQLDVPAIFSTLLPTNTIYTLTLASRWVPDRFAVLAFMGHSAVWDLGIETRSAAEIHELISTRVPLRVVDGRVAPSRGRVEGKVTRTSTGELYVAGRHAGTTQPFNARVLADGTFAFDDLPLGTYELSAGGPKVTANVTGLETVHVDLTAP